MKYHSLIVILLLMVACQAPQKEPVVKSRYTEIVALYFEGLASGEVSTIPLTKDVVFEGPLLNEPIIGEAGVRQLLGAIARSFEDAELTLESIVSEKDHACLIFKVNFPQDSLIIPVIDRIIFRNDSISYIRPYFDPRGYLEMKAREN